MEEKKLTKLWKSALGEIQTEVSGANFLTLFKNTALLSVDDKQATIASPSTMTIDLLRRRYLPLLATTLKKHLGREVSIVFVPKPMHMILGKAEDKGPLFSALEQTGKPNGQSLASVAPPRQITRVRGEYTFETMAVSSSNQLAFVSAQTVAKNIGASYNPLFIYGPVGVGKTHLMQAIANEVIKKSPDKKIIYITSEEFTNEVVDAIRSNVTFSLKRKFRTIDLLLIDDVQFLAGKEKVQEELFHTFNILVDNKSQVVFSSDRPPHEIKKIEKRLSSRFSSGLTVDIEPPDLELRTAIILIKTRKQGIEVDTQTASTIAQYSDDIRALEGILLRIITEAKGRGEKVTREFAEFVLAGKKQTDVNIYHPDDIINGVCLFYNMKPTQIKSPKRSASLVKARQIIMYLLKTELGLPYVEIGNLLGGRDHTTIMHGVNKIENILSLKNKASAEIVGITRFIYEQKFRA